MRSSLWYILVSSAALALAGCGDSTTAAKPGKTAAANGHEEVTLRLAHATESGGDLPGAEKLYQQAVAQNQDSVYSNVELADFYKRHHEDVKAVDSLNAALKIEPDNSNIERSLANSYINIGEPDKALPVLEKAIATHPREALLYNSRGVAMDQTGNYPEAQNSYKMAYDIDPSGGTMYKVNLSMSYILQGSYDKAVSLLRPMLDSPDAPPIVRQNLALAYGLKGESDNALKLGLQDLSNSEAEENVRFYRMLAQKHSHNSGKVAQTTPAKPVPASVVKELFPEEEPLPPKTISQEAPLPKASAAPVDSVAIQDESAAAPAPAPVKKKVVVKPAETDDEETEASVPAPVVHKQTVPLAAQEPKPTLAPASGSTTSVAPDEDGGLPEPVLKPDSE